ncbi:hypothetical protein FAZ19_12975 [Sphingobacterium alkalisoli]|uniref:Uncharacterized protein n=1 Tax=Sphingobacterium alkalisoli TaxID=1874115 RepID=A0A4U0H2W8_9SPHI|nr:hypothetical protein [Sphingobacterium alkalisoli]TJY66003.1 hypothetical protein FAZ19_12975 [Sphingobacterium alkalisoli]GGH16884.1 hypothetical protein GCM10011418_19490 [Sphingobacterium alkalisoli]
MRISTNQYIIAFIASFFMLSSCEKGEKLSSFQEFARLSISGLDPNLIVYCNDIAVNLPHIPAGNVNISLVNRSTGEKVFEKGYEIVGEQTLYYFQDQLLTNPQDTMGKIEGTIQVRLANFSDKISDESKPIHLVFQQELGIDWDLFMNIYAEHSDTVYNVESSFGEEYSKLKVVESPETNNIYRARAKVLNEDKSPLKVDGKEVYLIFVAGSSNASIFTSYIPEDLMFSSDDLVISSAEAWVGLPILPNLFEN